MYQITMWSTLREKVSQEKWVLGQSSFDRRRDETKVGELTVCARIEPLNESPQEAEG